VPTTLVDMRRVCAIALLALISSCKRAPVAEPATIALEPVVPAPQSSAKPEVPPATVPEKNEAAELEARFENASALSISRGEAAYYSDELTGRPTASGEPYDPKKFTAAHRTLPLGTILRVVREDDQRTVYVRVNDRGPYGKKSRIVDLSRAAANHLGTLQMGVAKVRIEVVERPAK
jgi:rare lipoprotein A